MDERVEIPGVDEAGRAAHAEHATRRCAWGTPRARRRTRRSCSRPSGFRAHAWCSVAPNWAELVVRFLTNPLVSPLLLSLGAAGARVRDQDRRLRAGRPGEPGLARPLLRLQLPGRPGGMGGGHPPGPRRSSRSRSRCSCCRDSARPASLGIVALAAAVVLAHDRQLADGRRRDAGARGPGGQPGDHRRGGLRLAPAPAEQRAVRRPVPPAAARTRPTATSRRCPRVDLVGQDGIAVTDLRPAGTAQIGHERVDVVTEGEYVAAGRAGAGGAQRGLPARRAAALQ